MGEIDQYVNNYDQYVNNYDLDIAPAAQQMFTSFFTYLLKP